MCVSICIHIYIYIYRDRETERERERDHEQSMGRGCVLTLLFTALCVSIVAFVAVKIAVDSMVAAWYGLSISIVDHHHSLQLVVRPRLSW